jgi:hypothetical protein
MPRKTLKDRNQKRPSDADLNRIRPVLDDLIGIEDPDDLMVEIMSVLKITQLVPDVGNFYIFVYSPKTPNIEYDAHPFVAVTDIFRWGFRGINFHWGEVRQYTWEEIVGSLHLVYDDEVKDLQALPFRKINLNS